MTRTKVDPDTGEILQDAAAAPAPPTGRALARTAGGELERREGVAGVLRPVESPAALLEVQEQTRGLIAEVLKEGRDYGKIPGTDKNTLLQPGAQRVASAFGCTPETEILQAETDHDRVVHWEKKRKRWENGKFAGWERETGTSIGLYRYVARCRLVHRGTGVVVGEGMGICSSLEDRYVDRPRDLEHTIMRMAAKRALIAAVLQTFALSEQFADLEESKAEREALAYEEQLKLGRGRYFALLAEELPHPQAREYARKAYQEAHPKLPDSSASWELQHFERAVNEFERFGISETLSRAVAWKAQRDPAGPVDLELLDGVIASRDLSPEDQELANWLRAARVSLWIREQLSRLGGGTPAPDGPEAERPGPSGPSADDLEAQAAEIRAGEHDDDLPF